MSSQLPIQAFAGDEYDDARARRAQKKAPAELQLDEGQKSDTHEGNQTMIILTPTPEGDNHSRVAILTDVYVQLPEPAIGPEGRLEGPGIEVGDWMVEAVNRGEGWGVSITGTGYTPVSANTARTMINAMSAITIWCEVHNQTAGGPR